MSRVKTENGPLAQEVSPEWTVPR